MQGLARSHASINLANLVGSQMHPSIPFHPLIILNYTQTSGKWYSSWIWKRTVNCASVCLTDWLASLQRPDRGSRASWEVQQPTLPGTHGTSGRRTRLAATVSHPLLLLATVLLLDADPRLHMPELAYAAAEEKKRVVNCVSIQRPPIEDIIHGKASHCSGQDSGVVSEGGERLVQSITWF